jgi:MinD-like ATPase involved in chromosome partitioning or flagellar assembly
MIVVTALSAKGGVGKTTIVTSLALSLALRNYRVWLIDMDPSSTAARSLGVVNPRGVPGILTFLAGAAGSVRVMSAVVDGEVVRGLRIVPPGEFNHGAPITGIRMDTRLDLALRAIGSHRASPSIVLIDTPSLSLELAPNLMVPLILSSSVLLLVGTDEPGGLSWVNTLLRYSSNIQGRREYVLVLNKLMSIKGGVDTITRYVVRILRSNWVEASWRLGRVPYVVKHPSLRQFKESIDSLSRIIEKLNAELTWVLSNVDTEGEGAE